jgi:hypothetical protein
MGGLLFVKMFSVLMNVVRGQDTIKEKQNKTGSDIHIPPSLSSLP